MHPPEILPASEVCDNDFNEFVRGPFYENRKYRRANGSKKKKFVTKDRQPFGVSNNIDVLSEITSITKMLETAPEIDRQDLCDRFKMIKERLSHV